MRSGFRGNCDPVRLAAFREGFARNLWRPNFSEAGQAMQIGAAMFFTDYSMSPADLARALEERGFESVWAPEHSHIPLSRKTPFPGGGELPKAYFDAMDP